MGFVVGSHCRCAAVPARKAGPGRPQEALDNPTTTKANFNLVTPDRPSSTHVFNWYICFERLYRVRRRRLEDAADRLQRVGFPRSQLRRLPAISAQSIWEQILGEPRSCDARDRRILPAAVSLRVPN